MNIKLYNQATKEEIDDAKKHGVTIDFSGPPASGKTRLMDIMCKALKDRAGSAIYFYDPHQLIIKLEK